MNPASKPISDKNNHCAKAASDAAMKSPISAHLTPKSSSNRPHKITLINSALNLAIKTEK